MRRRKTRGNKYERAVGAELDLHGYSANEARTALDVFLREAKLARHTLVRVVVGRGTHSAHGPVLPDTVKSYLNAQGLMYTYAKVFEGGEGALLVHLP